MDEGGGEDMEQMSRGATIRVRGWCDGKRGNCIGQMNWGGGSKERNTRRRGGKIWEPFLCQFPAR